MSMTGLFAAFVAIVLVVGSWIVGCALAGRAVDPTPHLMLLALLALSTQLSSLLHELRSIRGSLEHRVASIDGQAPARALDQSPAAHGGRMTADLDIGTPTQPAGDRGPLTCCGQWLRQRVRLPHPVQTPLGNKVGSAAIRVDVTFEVVDSGRIEVHAAKLSRPGDGSKDQRDRFNAMTAAGERFTLDAEFDGAELAKAVAQELDMGDGSLARELASQWRKAQAGRGVGV